MRINCTVARVEKLTLQCDVRYTARTVLTLHCTLHINSNNDYFNLKVVISPVRCSAPDHHKYEQPNLGSADL